MESREKIGTYKDYTIFFDSNTRKFTAEGPNKEKQVAASYSALCNKITNKPRAKSKIEYDKNLVGVPVTVNTWSRDYLEGTLTGHRRIDTYSKQVSLEVLVDGTESFYACNNCYNGHVAEKLKTLNDQILSMRKELGLLTKVVVGS